MRALVTGAQGFVGGWLRAHLDDEGDEIVAADEPFDVTSRHEVDEVVRKAEPDAIYHLAALTNVGDSWAEPERTFEVNAVGTLHVLEAARALPRPPRVLLVCSAEVYGVVRPEQVPINEDAPLRPVTPYAASKVAAEFLGMQAHLAYGLPVIRVRAFNHVGPSQAGSFVVADLARRIVDATRTGAKVLPVGNLSPRRDFTDVRDVVRAYRLLVDRGVAGEVYNVCSGRDVGIDELARRMLTLAGVDLELERDPALVRSVDVPLLVGDPTRLHEATGWQPEIPLDDTLLAILDEWRARA